MRELGLVVVVEVGLFPPFINRANGREYYDAAASFTLLPNALE
jgi:hypothetical protein